MSAEIFLAQFFQVPVHCGIPGCTERTVNICVRTDMETRVSIVGLCEGHRNQQEATIGGRRMGRNKYCLTTSTSGPKGYPFGVPWDPHLGTAAQVGDPCENRNCWCNQKVRDLTIEGAPI